MRINEFAKKYGVDKRSIDYWTNLGLLTTEGSEGNYCRVYGSKAEEEIKRILIAKAMGVDSKLKEYVDLLDHLPKELWKMVVIDKIDTEIKRITKNYEQAKKYAKELMES